MIEADIPRLGRDSYSLLHNYLILDFFDKQEQESFRLFTELPDNASLDEFRTLLHKIKSVRNLKKMLEDNVKAFQEMDTMIVKDYEHNI